MALEAADHRPTKSLQPLVQYSLAHGTRAGQDRGRRLNSATTDGGGHLCQDALAIEHSETYGSGTKRKAMEREDRTRIHAAYPKGGNSWLRQTRAA